MRILKRNSVLIISSNLKADEPSFDIEKKYSANDECEFEKFIYKALKESSGIKPSEGLTAWQKLRVSNEWACFDYCLNTISSAQNEIDVSFKCVGANAIYLNGVRAKRLIIEYLDERGNILESFEREFFEDKVSSWSEYFFGDWVEKTKAHDVFYECKKRTRSAIFGCVQAGLIGLR